MTRILAIDPGTTESAFVVLEHDTCRPVWFGKIPNEQLLENLADLATPQYSGVEVVAIEMVASYGMAVGREVFETCVWIGRFQQRVQPRPAQLVTRKPVKMHHCHSNAAKDSNIAQALKDRFALGQPNHGKGTKAAPGFFYGFRADVWQAYALGVYIADTTSIPSPADASSFVTTGDATPAPQEVLFP